MNHPLPCPCGSPLHFTHCCGAILSGARQAATAEQLMRSRYSAFCNGSVDYLIASLHPSKRHASDSQSLKESMSNGEWVNLNIIHTSKGQQNDNTGTVEFIATFKQQCGLTQLHEKSRFVKENSQWFYLDGDIAESSNPNSNRSNSSGPDSPTTKPKRNDPCWCGSGKKQKKCHG